MILKFIKVDVNILGEQKNRTEIKKFRQSLCKDINLNLKIS